MCFGGGSQTVTQKTTPELPKQYESILNTGNNIDQAWIHWLKGANNELDQSDFDKTVAGLTPDQLASQQMYRDIAGGDYKNQMQTALGMTKGASGMPDINAFYNPYQQKVIDTTLGAMDKRTAEQKAQLLAAQAGKKAFGSGSDIATSLFNRDAEDRAAQTLAQLQQSGYNTALGAAQNQQKQDLAAAGQYGQQAGALQQGQLSAAGALGQSGLNQQNFNQFQIDRPLNLAQQHVGMVSGAPRAETVSQQVPTASPFSQILGAGLAVGKLFFADGGLAMRDAFGTRGLAKKHAFADGGMAGAPVDMAQWTDIPTDELLFMLQKMDPADPNRDVVAEVYSRRQRDEGNRDRSAVGGSPSGRSAFDNGRVQDVDDGADDRRGRSLPSLGLGVTNKPFGYSSWGGGRTNPITPMPAWQDAIVTGLRSAFDNGDAQEAPEAQGVDEAPAPTQMSFPKAPTNLSVPSPDDIAASEEFNRMQAEYRAANPPTPRKSWHAQPPFLGNPPLFDPIETGPAGDSAFGPSGLSFGTSSGKKMTFSRMADAVDNLVSAVPGPGSVRSSAAVRKPSGSGLSFTRRRGTDVGALGAASPQAAAPAPSAFGAPANDDKPSSGGGFGDRIRKAMDSPLFWIGLGLMSSKNPDFLGALGEGVGSGLSAFSNRESDKAKQRREDQKSAHELAMENAKFGLQQTTAKNQMDLGRQRLQLAERADQRAARAANKPSALQEKIAAMKQMGASPEEIKRAVAGFKPEDDAEAQKQAFILDGLKKDPYGDPAALGEAFDGAMVSGASTDDLMAAVGMSGAGFANGGMATSKPVDGQAGSMGAGRLVQGPGDGRDDKIPSWLSDGEFVVPADVVSAFGRGSTIAGAEMLSAFTQQVRKGHARRLKDLAAPAI